MALPADARLDAVLERGELDGAYFFYGDAGRLRDEAAERLIDAAVDPSTRDFNLDRFRGEDVEPDELARALAMPPMMADRRVVAVFEAQGLTGRGRRAVEEALEAASAGLTLVVAATIPDRSKASFYKVLKKQALALEWSAPKEDELPGWIRERAEGAHGLRLGTREARALASAVGPDLGRLEAELEKLATAATGDAVSLETIRRLVPDVRDVDRWGWLDDVADRSYGAALERLPRLLSEPSESAVGLLVGMVDQHVFLGLALAEGRDGVARALQEAGKPYLKWKAKIYARQARSWSGGELERALGLMRRADGQAKSGLDDRRVLEELLLSLELLRERASARA